MRSIMFSRVYPKYHPKAGRPTWFVEKIWKSLWEITNFQGMGDYEANYQQYFPVGDLPEENIHFHLPKSHTIRAGNRWKIGDYFSHKLPFYDLLAMGVKATKDIGKKRAMMVYIEQYEPFIRQLVESINLPKKTLTIKKGQAMIWSAYLLHGGEKINDTGTTRYSQVTHYFFENCAYYTPRLSDVGINKVYMNDLVDISTGRKVVSTYFGKRVRSSNSIYLQQQGKQFVHALEKMLPEGIVNRLKKLIR